MLPRSISMNLVRTFGTSIELKSGVVNGADSSDEKLSWRDDGISLLKNGKEQFVVVVEVEAEDQIVKQADNLTLNVVSAAKPGDAGQTATASLKDAGLETCDQTFWAM